MKFLTTGRAAAAMRVVLAHGAGAPMDSVWMNDIAGLLARRSLCVLRFEFPYMAARRRGKRPGPNRPEVLLEAWRCAIRAAGEPASLVIGGKSLGGRVASMVADEMEVAGLVCLGYPFHPPGKPERLRTAHLADLRTPALFVQGERDTFGTRDETGDYALAPSIRFCWMPDGDHGFKPRKRCGHTLASNLEAAAAAVADFTASL